MCFDPVHSEAWIQAQIRRDKFPDRATRQRLEAECLDLARGERQQTDRLIFARERLLFWRGITRGDCTDRPCTDRVPIPDLEHDEDLDLES